MDENSKEYQLFEKAPVLISISRLALPTVAGQIILVLYNMADTFFIGMTGSDAKLTAVTVCMPAFMFLSAVSNLFGVGGSSEISRALGRKRLKHAAATSSFSFWGCVCVTLLYSLSVSIFMDHYVDLLGGGAQDVHLYAKDYLLPTVVWGGLGTSMNALLAHLLRSEGRSVQASVGIIAGGIMNIVLDPLFMFYLLPAGLEVAGAAYATALSNLMATLYFLGVIWRRGRHTVINFAPRPSNWDAQLVKNVLSTGLPACVMTLFENISFAVLDKLLMAHGTMVQAGIGVAKKVNMLAHCIVRGMTQGVLPLIAYNYASQNYRRMNEVVRASMLISIALASFCMGVCLFWSDALIGMFISGETDSLRYGATFLRILCLGGPVSACAYSIISFFQAVNRGRKSFILAILRKGVLDIPLMFVLGTCFPVYGVVWATPAADCVCCIVALALYCQFCEHRRQEMAMKFTGSLPSDRNTGMQRKESQT